MATETISLVLDETWALVSNAAAGSFGGFVVSGPVIWSLSSTQPAASRNYGITDKRLIYPSLDTKVYARSASGPALITVSRTVDAGNAAESTAMPNGGGSVSVTTFRNDVAVGSTVATITPSVTGAKATGIYPTNSGLRIGANGLDLIKTETQIPTGALNLTIIMSNASSLNSPTSFNASFDVTAPAGGGGVTPPLGVLTLSTNTTTYGTPFTSIISGSTPGSTITLSGLGSNGLSVFGNTISGTPVTGGPVDVIETLSGSPNSPKTLSNAISVTPPAIALALPTANMLAAMNATQADWDAIASLGLKQIGPSEMIVGRALDPGRTDNGRADDNYVSSRALARDFNGVVYENQFKPTYEIKQGELTTSGIVPGGPNSPGLYEPIDVTLARVAPDMLNNKAFHLGSGWNSYLPSSSVWTTGATGGTSLIQKLTDDPAYMKTYLDNRVAQIAAFFAARPGEAAKYHRVDIVNELSNQPVNGVAAVDDGWRTTNNALRTASKTAAGLEAYGAGNTDSEKWIQRLFTQFRDIFPNADLCWCDFNTEQIQVADDLLSARYSYNPSGPTSLYSVAADNSGANARFRLERIKGEIFRYKKAGIPVTGIANQMHTSSFYALAEIDYRAALWDYNRWGIRPAATEVNADMFAPGQLGSSPGLETVHRYNAVHCARQIEIMLEETNCREVMLWTVKNAAGNADIQPTSHKDRDYPLRSALAIVLKRAKPVAQRTLKRGNHWTFRTRLSQNQEATGTQSFSGNKLAQTATGYVRRGWDWYNDTWMPMPIAAATMIPRAQFTLGSAFPAGGSGILGEASTDGATGIYLVGKGTALYVRQRIAGVNTDTLVPNVTLSTTNTVKQAAYLAMSADRTTVKVGYGTLTVTSDATTGVVTVTPTQVAEQTVTLPASQPVKTDGHIYVCSDAQSSAFHSGLQMAIAAVYHGPDYPTDAARQALSIPYRQEAWVPTVSGAIYAGD